MSSEYGCFLTNLGLAAITNAFLLGETVALTHIAVGDGDDPITQDMTELHSERARVAVNRISRSPEDDTIFETDGYIPADVGGWNITEAGLFDEDGNLFAVSKYPPTYKPALESGAAVDLQIRLLFRTENADNVTLKIDPAIIMASRAYVDDLVLPIALQSALNAVEISNLKQLSPEI